MKISFRFGPTPASESTRARRRRSLMLASVGIALLPLAWRGVACGHDFDFHLESWMEVARQWHQGVFYPHWAASANFGAGEPRFVFYPPLSWMLGALLGAVLPWTWTPLLFTLLAMLAMAATFFWMAREWMPEDNAALAACLYVLNPYMLFVAYERAAYGELLSAVWLPLLVLYALRKSRSIPQLAFAVAGLWLSDVPAAVMGCYALAILVLWSAIVDGKRRWKLIGRAIAGIALGLGFAGFFLVPAIVEQHWIEIGRALVSGMRIEDSFLFERTGEAFHDQVLYTASWIAVALLEITVIAAALAYRNRQRDPRRNQVRGAMIFLAAVIAALLLPFSDAIWRHAPELRFVQFPWRWLLVLGLAAALLAGLGLRSEAGTRRAISLRAVAILLLACAMAGVAGKYFWQLCDDEDNVRAQLTAFHAGGFEGTDEYTAAGTDNGDIQQGLPPIRILSDANEDEADSSVQQNPPWPVDPSPPSTKLQPSQTHIDLWQVERMAATIQVPAPSFAVLRLMDYPAWRVRVNGQPVVARPHRDDGLMAIPLPAGKSHIEIAYRTTWDVWAGRILSLFCFVLLLCLRTSQLGLRRKQQVS